MESFLLLERAKIKMRPVCHLDQRPVRCGAGRLGSVNRTIGCALRLRSKKFQRYTLYFLISRCPGHGRRGEGHRVGAPAQLAGLTRDQGSEGEPGSRPCGLGWSAETRSKPEPAVQPQGLGEGNPLSHRFPLPAQVCWATGREAGGTSGLGSGASPVATVHTQPPLVVVPSSPCDALLGARTPPPFKNWVGVLAWFKCKNEKSSFIIF